jgi:hypothetical protein
MAKTIEHNAAFVPCSAWMAAPAEGDSGRFLGPLFRSLTYSANRVPEISNSSSKLFAMRLSSTGNSALELWDAAGVEATVAR